MEGMTLIGKKLPRFPLLVSGWTQAKMKYDLTFSKTPETLACIAAGFRMMATLWSKCYCGTECLTVDGVEKDIPHRAV